MIYCSIHSRLFLPFQQVWIHAKVEEVPTFMRAPQVIERECDECIVLVKESLKTQFPALYTHQTLTPSP